MLKHLLFFIICFLFFSIKTEASTTDLKNNYISLKVIPEYLSIEKGTKHFDILLEITPKQNWHIYYTNPGDVGNKTELSAYDSQNFYLTTPILSAPKKETYENIITSFIYSQKFYLKQGVVIKDISNLKELNLSFNLSYSACHDECISEDIFFNVTIPVENIQIINNDYIKTFMFAEKQFPHNIPSTYEFLQNKLILSLKQNLDKDCDFPYFVSSSPKKNILSSLPTTKLLSKNKLEINFDPQETPDINGLILCPNHAYSPLIINEQPVSKNNKFSSLVIYSLIAFIAGLILNLMPCVLPVLSLKALYLIKSNKAPSIKKALSYLFGVTTSFLSLAGILYYAKSIGSSLGWGFQLQSLEFNLFLLFLFFIIFLSLLDKITIPQKFTDLLNKLPTNSSFITGFFAVIVATPCTGPFMGTALGYALVSDTFSYFTIFVFLSLGYALPYTLIELNPKTFSKFLPKTGSWMIKFKHFLAIPIGLTCLWLGWVIYSQLNINYNSDEILWQNYSKEKIENSLNNNEKVFINFTAKWCLVCLLNEKTTLGTQKFKKLVEEKNIKLYKADFTNKDPNILKALESYGRNSVPLYIYYKPDTKNPKILPQILRINDLEKNI